jgi:alpha-L-fucosidase
MSQGQHALDETVDTSWFTRDRFGLFIHWGLYSLGARHEWLQNNEKIPPGEYEARYFGKFDPDLYDPKVWADAAAGAGMKYFVVTTKHHEGFCLFDSKHTDFKATNTPARRDLIQPMVEAFTSRGLRTGFYYSLIDWHHPDFLVDPHIGPLRELPAEERARINEGRDQSRYARYMRDQVTELLTSYGKVDLMWFDFSYPKEDGSGKSHEDWESAALHKLIRRLSPGTLIDDRLDLPNTGNFVTPEQYQPESWMTVNGRRVVWEACQTLSGSWGYHRDESSWRSVENLLQTLIDSVSKGGNFLLNVGPTGRGELDERALSRLAGIGEWMRRHSRSIYGCTQAPEGLTVAPPDSRLTYNPATRRLYVHLFAYPYKYVHLPRLAGKVEYAQLLHDASEVPLKMDHFHASLLAEEGNLTVTLPQNKPSVTVPVVELFLK